MAIDIEAIVTYVELNREKANNTIRIITELKSR